MCKNIYIFFLVTLTTTAAEEFLMRQQPLTVIMNFFINSVFYATTAAEDLCPNGATCLSSQNCPGLYKRLKELNQGSQVIISVLRRLHCGYDKNIPKICCPPGLQDIIGLDLLPNTAVCGIQMDERIYGGVQTGIDEHPWTVLIRHEKLKKNNFNGGGVLISSRYVITAAHCFKGYNIPQDDKLFHVRLGEWNLATRNDCLQEDCSPDPLNVDVEKIILHENYDPSVDQQNDIALVRLIQDVPFTDFVKPICLPIEPTLRINSFETYDMETTGWGKTEIGSSSDVKLKTNLRVTNREDCRIIYKFENRNITEKQLCAGGIGGKDSCRGDSGGALMGQLGATKNWMAVGITSFGPFPCGTVGWPGVYTRVTEYIDWILSTIRP